MARFAPVDRFRRPEYTGANRCLPCTIVNGAIALVAAVVLGTYSLALGAAVLLVSAGVIYLRGYLVPGTPQLTERYLPDPVLAWFEKGGAPAPVPDVDPEEAEVGELLYELGVVEECRDGMDFCLVDAFHDAWREETDHLREVGTERADLAGLLDTDPDALTFHEPYDEGFVARANNLKVGQWESEAAFLADLGAARALDRHVQWQGFDVATKGALLNGLRLFIEECPDCGGPVALGEETVRSCCRSHEVVAASCQSCGARLFEAPNEP